jgi:hypothetical protein
MGVEEENEQQLQRIYNMFLRFLASLQDSKKTKKGGGGGARRPRQQNAHQNINLSLDLAILYSMK